MHAAAMDPKYLDSSEVTTTDLEHEKEIAELLERELGGEIYMVPRVNNPQGVRTPDYLSEGKVMT